MTKLALIHRLSTVSFSSNFVILFNFVHIPTLNSPKIKQFCHFFWQLWQRLSLSCWFFLLIVDKLIDAGFLVDLQTHEPKLSAADMAHEHPRLLYL